MYHFPNNITSNKTQNAVTLRILFIYQLIFSNWSEISNGKPPVIPVEDFNYHVYDLKPKALNPITKYEGCNFPGVLNI